MSCELLDRTLFTWVQAHRASVLNGPMWLLSVVGRGGLIWFGFALLLTARACFGLRRWIQLALVIAATSLVVDRVVKPVVNRSRPFDAIPSTIVIGGRPHDASFPSGHAANAFAGAWTLTMIAPAGAVWWWVVALGIAGSRVYLGVHYPTDVIGGALIGLCIAGLSTATGFLRRS